MKHNLPSRGKDIEKHIESLSTAPTASSSAVSHENWGVIPRAVESLFEELRSIGRHGAAAVVYCSYMQIYNNDVYDLLQENKQRTKEPLAVREMIKGNSKQIYVSGLSEFRVTSLDETLRLLKAGNRNRTIRATEYNEKSSRSHALLQISAEVESRGIEGATTIIRRAKLNLVDLAGSEKWDTDVSIGADRSKELAAINQSLSALGNVISALTNPKRSHIPYRDSKLTRLLQDSLGGNTRTVVIATISPSEAALDETISTLQFADRAKCVTVRVKVNEMVDDAILLARAQREIARLKVLMKESGSQQHVAELEEQVAKLKKENAMLVAENNRLRKKASSIAHAARGSSERGGAAGNLGSLGLCNPSEIRPVPSTEHDRGSSQRLGNDRSRVSKSESINRHSSPARGPHPGLQLSQLRLDLLDATAPLSSTATRSTAFGTFLDDDDDRRDSGKLHVRLEDAEREHERILRGIQTERRDLEQKLEQLSQNAGRGDGATLCSGIDCDRQASNNNAVDSDELCPMCGHNIDDHSDAALDLCIEKEELEVKARQARDRSTPLIPTLPKTSRGESAGNQQSCEGDNSTSDHHQLGAMERRPGPQVASIPPASNDSVEQSASVTTPTITPRRTSTSAGDARPSPYLQELALKPSTPSSQSKSRPFVKRRSLRDGGGGGGVSSTKGASTARNSASAATTSCRNEQDTEAATTSCMSRSNASNQHEPQFALSSDVPILRHSHKSVKELKKLHALSPYNLRLLKRANGLAGDNKKGTTSGGAELKVRSEVISRSSPTDVTTTPTDANAVVVTNSIRDIGLKLTVYKFRRVAVA